MLIKLIQPRMTMRPMDSIVKPRMAPSLGLLTLATLTAHVPAGTVCRTLRVFCTLERTLEHTL
jgi:hypothetical protein